MENPENPGASRANSMRVFFCFQFSEKKSLKIENTLKIPKILVLVERTQCASFPEKGNRLANNFSPSYTKIRTRIFHSGFGRIPKGNSYPAVAVSHKLFKIVGAFVQKHEWWTNHAICLQIKIKITNLCSQVFENDTYIHARIDIEKRNRRKIQSKPMKDAPKYRDVHNSLRRFNMIIENEHIHGCGRSCRRNPHEFTSCRMGCAISYPSNRHTQASIYATTPTLRWAP